MRHDVAVICRVIDESIPWLLANGRVQEAETIVQKAARISGKHMPFPVFKQIDKSCLSTKESSTILLKNMENSCKNRNVELIEKKDATVGHTDDVVSVQGDAPHYQIWDILRNRTMLSYTVILCYTW